MIHSKAIDILKTVTKEELKQFSDFIRSPFHNKNKKLIVLFDALEKYHPEYAIDIEKIYSKVYPAKIFNNNNFKKLMSEMYQLLQNFLFCNILFSKEKENTREFYLIDEYNNRNLDSLFIQKSLYVQEKYKENDTSFEEKSKLESLISQFYIFKGRYDLCMDNLLNRSKYNISSFLFYTFLDLGDFENIKKYYKSEKLESITEKFIKHVNLNSFYEEIENGEDIFLKLACNLILLNLNKDERNYFSAKKLILNSIKISSANIVNIFIYIMQLISFCRYKSNKGFDNFEVEIYYLYKAYLDLEKYCDMNAFALDLVIYSNIIKASLYNEEIEWAEEFISKYTKFLDPNIREDMVSYAKSFIEFSKSNYEQSLKFISTVGSTNYGIKINIKILTLKCFYELDFFESAISALDSLKRFFPDYGELDLDFKENNKKILKNYKELLKLKMNPEKFSSIKFYNLKSEIETTPCFEKKWFLKKHKELEKIIYEKSKAKKQKHLKSA